MASIFVGSRYLDHDMEWPASNFTEEEILVIKRFLNELVNVAGDVDISSVESIMIFDDTDS